MSNKNILKLLLYKPSPPNGVGMHHRGGGEEGRGIKQNGVGAWYLKD